jgi:BASS family bile acid:Na+ symporter
MMALALSITRVARLGDRQKTAITLECGLQNGTLAIFVAITLIGSKTMMVPGAIYSLLMFPTAIAYVFIAKKRYSAQ